MTRIEWFAVEIVAGAAACLAAWLLAPFCVVVGFSVVSAAAAYAVIMK